MQKPAWQVKDKPQAAHCAPWLPHCAEVVGSRQVFVSTQHPLQVAGPHGALGFSQASRAREATSNKKRKRMAEQ